MAKSRSPKSIYKSNYGGGHITPQQYLMECLCVLIAKQNKIQLSHRFWREEYWAKIFKTQSTHLKNLLKDYPHTVILEALRDRRCWKIHSFGAKWLLEPILKQKMKLAQTQKILATKTERRKIDPTQLPRKPAKKPSVLNRLKEIDG